MKLDTLLKSHSYIHYSQISRSEVDQPEMEKFRPENLHDYPPRIICRFFPEENAPKRTICTISLSGLLPQVEFYIPLKAPTFKVAVDTTKLQVNFVCILYYRILSRLCPPYYNRWDGLNLVVCLEIKPAQVFASKLCPLI